MPNIMINKICNLQCPYCFANKFVNNKCYEDENNITLENFEKALNFISSQSAVGIIGGEPTLHPKFRELINMALSRENIEHILIFSNGIELEKYADLIANERISLLINTNSPEDIGENQYKKVLNTIKTFSEKFDLPNQKISLGVNIYSNKKDYSYIFEPLKILGGKELRISVVVPNTNEKRNMSTFEYFNRIKPTLFEFIKQCKEHDVMPYYDCNNFPACLWNEEEIKFIDEYLQEFKEKYQYCSNLLELPHCRPVIDILPDLRAVRCFGCSDDYTPICNFKSLEDLKKFFEKEIDSYAVNIPMDEECKNCYCMHNDNCSGGCLAFKRNRLVKNRDISNIINLK